MIVLNIFYYSFYGIAILYKYFVEYIVTLLNRLPINLYGIFNVLYYKNPLILFSLFSIWWDIKLEKWDILWVLFAFPTVSAFFLTIGIRTTRIPPILKLPIALSITIIPTIAVTAKALYSNVYYGIGFFLIPFMIFKIACYFLFKGYATFEFQNVQDIQDRENAIKILTQKNANLHFGWFSLPIILLTLFESIKMAFEYSNQPINDLIIFYIIFGIGMYCAGVTTLIKLLFDRYKEMGLSYVVAYVLGVFTDELIVDFWLKKVVFHSLLISNLLFLILTIF